MTLAVSIALDRRNSDGETPRNCAVWASTSLVRQEADGHEGGALPRL